MRPTWLVLTLALAAACTDPAAGDSTGTAVGSAATGRNGARPLPSVSVGVTIANLSATWVFGDKNEPPAGPVVVCNPNQTMSLVQDGQRILGSIYICPGLCGQAEDFEGQNVAGKVTLNGTYNGNLGGQAQPVSYDLTYNEETQHLVGKRDGASFWAAPFGDPGRGYCGATPTPVPNGVK